MTRELQGTRFTVRLSSSLRNVLTNGQVVRASQPNFNYNASIGNGAASGSADRAWEASGTLLSGATLALDLATMSGVDIGPGVGKDALGMAVDYQNIVAILISNNNIYGLPGQLEVYPAVAQGWAAIGSHLVSNGGALKGKGMLIKYQPEEGGFDLDGTNTNIVLHASGGAVAYTICLLARSDDDDSSSSSPSSLSSSSST